MPFEKGKSGNPAGGKNTDWTQAIKRALARKGEGDYYAGLNQIADRLVADAIDGDKDARKEIGERLDGKPTTYAEVTHHKQSVRELDDSELLEIIRGAGDAEPAAGAARADSVH